MGFDVLLHFLPDAAQALDARISDLAVLAFGLGMVGLRRAAHHRRPGPRPSRCSASPAASPTCRSSPAACWPASSRSSGWCCALPACRSTTTRTPKCVELEARSERMDLTILFGVFTLLMLIGTPIAFCLGIASFATVLYLGLPPLVVFQRVASGVSRLHADGDPVLHLRRRPDGARRHRQPHRRLRRLADRPRPRRPRPGQHRRLDARSAASPARPSPRRPRSAAS